MKIIVSKTKKKSVFAAAMMMFFVVFMAKATDQTVSINGLATASEIQNVVQNAINATGSSGTVTVTGTTEKFGEWYGTIIFLRSVRKL